MRRIIDRVLYDMGDGDLLDKLLSLPKSDLNSLLLEVYRLQVEKVTPAGLLKAYKSNRFAVPSQIDPIAYHQLETELLKAAEDMGIKGILLSPSAPFGSCSVFGCVDQNNVISAARGTETLSDPTNMLAVIISDELKNGVIAKAQRVHYCTTARVVRAQAFSGKGFFSHFGIFCMVSHGKDGGSYCCEKELLVKQLEYYKRLFNEKYGARLSVTLRKRSGYTDGDGFFERMTELVRAELPEVPLSLDLEHEDNNYYKGINFKMYMEKDNETVEIGDGGFVDWIAKMTGNKKERCLISGLGIDRMLLL
ncbi:hypothetical protein OXPF_05930 [Oxobacter pfennigii]|uniref:Uncharacterized protein n=1 Tax=Oxobacter pfennigii TaxID=36849 RepID=A0A0P8WT48_9CLOT|nr:hypothetical protein [Oxobacter pfennigii]KPU45804.1 hypothetical protein OXPF_05930 [Oxobacter pfennigii]